MRFASSLFVSLLLTLDYAVAQPAWPEYLDFDFNYRNSAANVLNSPWDIRLGIGLESEPTYQGSNKQATELDPFLVANYRAEWGNLFLTAEGFGFSTRIGQNFGLLLNLEQEDTREIDDDDRLIGLQSQDKELELEIEATYFLNQWNFGASIAPATGNKGIVWFVGGGYTWRPAEQTFVQLSLDLSGSDKDNQRTDFGISLQDAMNTGFRPYTPEGGLKSAGWSISVDHQFSERWFLRGEASYERLLGDVAESPLVKDIGRKNQYELGIGIYYQF